MRSSLPSRGACLFYVSTMRTCYIGLLLLIITLQQSRCSEEEIPQADEEDDSFPATSWTYQNDHESHYLTYDKLSATVDNYRNCYEWKEKPIPLKLREDLNASLTTLTTEKPVEYVIVRVSKENCTYEKECLKIMQKIIKKELGKGCDPVDNFYVGGDGFVYEGRGWDKAPYWDLNGLRRKAITVQFFGNYIPPPPVMEAFRTTLQIGVWLGKLSKNYKVVSMRQLFNNSAYPGVKLDKYLMTWKSWANATFISSRWEHTIPRRLTFVFRSQWNASEPLKESVPITQPVGHVMISDGGERCLSRSECSSRVKAEQTEQKAHYGDLPHNFYVGEEGEVYEGRGWDAAPQWEFPGIKSGLLSVKLIGSFESGLPSERAVNSLKNLIRTGVWLGKISQGYSLFSLRQAYGERSLTGEALHKHAEGWAPRWEQGDRVVRKEDGKPQPLPFIGRSVWGASFPAWGAAAIRVAVDYVIVYDGADRCFTRRECTSRVKKEEEEYRSNYGSLLDNFYVGEDGSFYEGRGWEIMPQWSSLFPGISFITVKFMGSFEEDAPTWLAFAAFNSLLKYGVDSGMISPEHKLITLRHTYPVAPSLPNALEGRLKEMTCWSSKITSGTNGSTPLYRNLIFPRDRWATWPQPNDLKLKHPIDYVVIGSTGPRCFTQFTCTHVLKNRYDGRVNHLKSILDNFYIGEDGWAYEGKGWDGASRLNFKERDHNFLFVRFLGSFDSALPSPIAMYGFHHLMEFGLSAGKLAPDYKIVSITQMFHDSKSPVDMLSESVKSWSRWSESVAYSSGQERSPSGNSIYVPRQNWSAESWTPSLPKLNDRIHRIYVRNVGGRCFTPEECASAVRAERNKSSTRSHWDRFVAENFYVGEDGHVYEGRGWDSPPPWVGGNRELITVAFLGNFERDLPSPKAVFAFNYLIKLGMSLGHIRSSYRLESLKSTCATGIYLGDALDQEIKSWEMWSPSSPIACPSDSLPST